MDSKKITEFQTYVQAYFEAFLFPVNKGESSARNLIKVLTLSASPGKIKERKKNN